MFRKRFNGTVAQWLGTRLSIWTRRVRFPSVSPNYERTVPLVDQDAWFSAKKTRVRIPHRAPLACSSAVEHSTDNRVAPGSNPGMPTIIHELSARMRSSDDNREVPGSNPGMPTIFKHSSSNWPRTPDFQSEKYGFESRRVHQL